MSKLILSFDKVGLGDAALVGGKGANLGELTRAGIPVPPGFIITTEGWDFHLRYPAEFDALIETYYEWLGGGKVAVRSSATGEDGSEQGFAGMHDTYLNVTTASGVIEAVFGCWHSLHGDRAAAYRRANNIDHRDVEMAVVVQRMVQAQHSGVAFTCDPVLGEPDIMLIEAVEGLGEALVSGRVTPVTIEISKDLQTIHFGGGRQVLNTEQTIKLGALLLRIEEHYGFVPQDVEWAEVEGEFFILQSRPVTGN